MSEAKSVFSISHHLSWECFQQAHGVLGCLSAMLDISAEDNERCTATKRQNS